MKLFLVTGTMRSGTSLVAELLYSRAYGQPTHPNVSLSNDNFDMLKDFLFAARKRIEGENPVESWHNLSNFKQAEIEAAYEESTGTKKSLNQIPSDIFAKISAIAPNNGEVRAYGSKSTGITSEIDILDKIYHNFGVIILVRDPRDVLASNLKRVGAARQLDGYTIVATLCDYQYFMEARQNSRNLLTLRYEDIVHNPVQELTKILNFISVEPGTYDWERLSSGKVISNTSYSRDRGREVILDHGVAKTSVGKFKQHLSADDTKAIEIILQKHFHKYGYNISNKNQNTDKEFMFWWLLPIYIQCKKNNISVFGLNKYLRDNDMEDFISDFSRIQSFSDLLLKDKKSEWDLFHATLTDITFSKTCRYYLETQISNVQSAIALEEWSDYEQNLITLIGGEQNKERKVKLCIFYLAHMFGESSLEIESYLNWARDIHPSMWRIIITRLLRLNIEKDTVVKTTELRDELIEKFDALILEHSSPNDMTMAKIDTLFYYGRGSWEKYYLKDVEKLIIAKKQKKLSVGLEKRLNKLLNSIHKV